MRRGRGETLPQRLQGREQSSTSRPLSPRTISPAINGHRLSYLWSSNLAHTFWTHRSVFELPSAIRDISPWCLASVLATLIALAAVLLVITLLLGSPTKDRDHPSTVQVFLTGFIKVEGIVVLADNTEVFAFLGIRYARPPLSSGRFQPAVPMDAPELSTIDATQVGPPCIQKGRNGSEDCLTLNIWTPKLNCTEDTEECGNRTVIFFLHGGFFQIGGNADYDGRFLSALGNLVVVVPNYRLGALGFLKLDAREAPGDVGLVDQLEALFWTRDNIRMFGGNPNKIVLMGHESGAKSIGHRLYDAYQFLGVKRAILLSGSAYTRYPEQINLTRERLVRAVSCPRDPGKALACLKALPATSYTVASGIPHFFPSFNVTVTDFAGNTTDVPDIMDVLIGYVEDEGTLLVSLYLDSFIKQIPVFIEQGLVYATTYMLQRIGFNGSTAKKIVQDYVTGFGGSRESWIEELTADVQVVCPLQQYAAHLTSKDNRILTYYAGRQEDAIVSRVQHGYVTGLLFGSYMTHFRSPDEKTFNQRVIKFFADFANGFDSLVRPENITGAGYSIVFSPFEQTVNDTAGFRSRQKRCDYLGPF